MVEKIIKRKRDNREELGKIHSAIGDLSKLIRETSDEDICIENLDEVKLHLKTELGILLKGLVPLLNALKPINEVSITNFPDSPESVNTKMLDTIRDQLSQLISMVAQFDFDGKIYVDAPIIPEIKVPAAKVDVRIPKIEIPKPNIKIDPIVDLDFSPLLKALKPLGLISGKAGKPISVRLSDGRRWAKAIKQVGETISTTFNQSNALTNDQFKRSYRQFDNPLMKYKISDIDDDASPNYYGFLAADGSYYILRETVTAGNSPYRYSSGNSAYATAWTNRATETYQSFNDEFSF